jgi:predicted ATP-grasp superfamily ATP-dependent carboligase
MTLNVLVTDGEQRAALAVTRSLGHAGYRVFTAAASTSLAGASRWSAGKARVPDPLLDPSGFVATVAKLIGRWNIDVLVPAGEAALLAILPVRLGFPDVLIPFPDAEAFARISDKDALLTTAARLGIAHPRSLTLTAPASGTAAVEAALRFPVVVKPSRTVQQQGDQRIKGPVSYASSPLELTELLLGFPDGGYPLLIQERIVGDGTGIFLLRWGGRTRAVFAHRRLREKPPSGGVSVYSESIAPDPELVRSAEALLSAYDWQGVAMVEFKRDGLSGVPYLMEVNGRFWGSLQLAVDSGVDFPALLLAAALGTESRPLPIPRAGVRSRWWWGDIDHLLTRLRRSPEALHLPAGTPSRWDVASEVLLPWRSPGRNEVFRTSDPLPGLVETLHWLRNQL